jgi:hypothetical protein
VLHPNVPYAVDSPSLRRPASWNGKGTIRKLHVEIVANELWLMADQKVHQRRSSCRLCSGSTANKWQKAGAGTALLMAGNAFVAVAFASFFSERRLYLLGRNIFQAPDGIFEGALKRRAVIYSHSQTLMITISLP